MDNFKGYAVQRKDNGLFWNKVKGWDAVPHIYENSAHAKNSSHQHCNGYVPELKRKGVKIPYRIVTCSININISDIILDKNEGDNPFGK